VGRRVRALECVWMSICGYTRAGECVSVQETAALFSLPPPNRDTQKDKRAVEANEDERGISDLSASVSRARENVQKLPSQRPLYYGDRPPPSKKAKPAGRPPSRHTRTMQPTRLPVPVSPPPPPSQTAPAPSPRDGTRSTTDTPTRPHRNPRRSRIGQRSQ